MAQLASLGDEVKIWDVASFTLKEQFFTTTDGVKDLGWNHDGTLLASSCKTSPSISVRMMIGAEKRSTVSHSFELPAVCCCVDFASKYLLAACEDGSLQILDLQTTKLHKSFTGNKFPITVARWNWNEQNIAFGCQTGQIILYNVITGQASSPFKPLSSQTINQLKYNPYRKSSLASAAEDGVVAFWDTNTRSRIHSFSTSHQAPAIDLAFSPVNDHLMVSVGLDKRLVLYDVQGKSPIKTIVADYPLTSLDMQDGSMVTVGTSRGKIFVYDLRKADVPVVTVPAHKSSVKRICYSRKEVASPGASQPKEIASPGAAQPREISLSTFYDDVVGSQINNSNSMGTGPGGILSFLRDDSSTHLTHSHNNNNTNNSSSFVGYMSPAVSGHPHPYSGEYSRSGVSNTGGTSSLYSFLRDESSHHHSHKAAAENSGSYMDNIISSRSQRQDGSHNRSEDKKSPPRASDVLRRTPPRRLLHGADQIRSPANVHFKLDSPRREKNEVPIVNGNASPSSIHTINSKSRTDSSNVAAIEDKSYPSTGAHSKLPPQTEHNEFESLNGRLSPSSTYNNLRSRTTSYTLAANDLHHVKKTWLDDFKSEVKALIKDELNQPQLAERASRSIQLEEGGQENKIQPQLFQEEYLRKLIRDELESVMEQSHRDYLELRYEMNKLHFDMWWWLDHRFSEQLSNPTLMEQINRLTEEVNRLRRGYRY